jgi:hypothetical protein
LSSQPDVLITDAFTSRTNVSSFGGDIFSAWTLALIPVVQEFDETMRFRVSSPDESDSADVTLRFRRKDMFGWIALLLIPFPRWEWNTYNDRDELQMRLRLELLSVQPAIEQMVEAAESP